MLEMLRSESGGVNYGTDGKRSHILLLVGQVGESRAFGIRKRVGEHLDETDSDAVDAALAVSPILRQHLRRNVAKRVQRVQHTRKRHVDGVKQKLQRVVAATVKHRIAKRGYRDLFRVILQNHLHVKETVQPFVHSNEVGNKELVRPRLALQVH